MPFCKYMNTSLLLQTSL